MQWINYFPEQKKKSTEKTTERVSDHGVHFDLPSSLWDVGEGKRGWGGNAAEWNLHGLQLDWSNLETPEEKRAPRALGPL